MPSAALALCAGLLSGGDEAPRIAPIASEAPLQPVAVDASPIAVLSERAAEVPPLVALAASEDLVAAVDSLSDAELDLALSLVLRDPAERDALREPRRLARALARIATAGPDEATSEPSAPWAAPVEFSARPADAEQRAETLPIFESSAHRIYGYFPLSPSSPPVEVAGSPEAVASVIAKWARIDQAELLELEALPVAVRDGYAHLRLDRREGWPQGAYRLEVYSIEDRPRLLAIGDFTTRGERVPRRVVFHDPPR